MPRPIRLTARLTTLLFALLWISSCEEPKVNSQLENPSINNQSSAQSNTTPLDSDIPEGRLPEIAYPLYYTLDLEHNEMLSHSSGVSIIYLYLTRYIFNYGYMYN